MPKKLIPLAIAYDFDGTLAPGNMQEFDFVPKLGLTSKDFWAEVTELSKEHNADNILVYMGLMLEKAAAKHISVHKADFLEFGKTVPLFDGVLDWFERVDKHGRESGVKVEHFILSSGLGEMIEGTPIAKRFTKIYASGFRYDHNGVAHWPAMALNYTTKTQYLFRINKGALDVWDHSVVNSYVKPADRPVPFKNMIYIGDGETDVPCFRLVKDQGGHAIAVYKPNAKRGEKERAQKLLQEGRVNFSTPASYIADSEIEKIVKGIIRQVAAEGELRRLAKKAQ